MIGMQGGCIGTQPDPAMAAGVAEESSDRDGFVNLQTQTRTHFPESLYESFENAYSESIDLPSRRNLPSIRAWRPKNTYYRGLQTDADATPAELPLKPEITVVSRVRLYYLSPAHQPKDMN